MPIGWFGIPGSDRGTKTHVVSHTRELLCGSHVNKRAEFQWCAEINPLTLNEIECLKCRNKAIDYQVQGLKR